MAYVGNIPQQNLQLIAVINLTEYNMNKFHKWLHVFDILEEYIGIFLFYFILAFTGLSLTILFV